MFFDNVDVIYLRCLDDSLQVGLEVIPDDVMRTLRIRSSGGGMVSSAAVQVEFFFILGTAKRESDVSDIASHYSHTYSLKPYHFIGLC